MKLLISLYASCLVLSAAAFDLQHWAYRRAVQPSGDGFHSLPVDADLYKTSQAELRDLRLLHSGKEVPYVLKVLAGSSERVEFTPSIVNKAVIPHVGLQFVLDLKDADHHNSVFIHTTKSDFKQTVRVETSDDRHSWGLVQDDANIFSLISGGHRFTHTLVSYPDSTLRYVRVTVKGWNNPAWVDSATAAFIRQQPALTELAADLRPTVTEKREQQETELLFDIGYSRPYDEIDLDIGPGLFSRPATIFTSASRENWLPVGYSTLERTSATEQRRALIPERWERYIRIVINNNDNAPLTITRARIFATRRELIFPAGGPGTYWLYSGNPSAEAASYDLARVLPKQATYVPATAKASEPNPDFRPPKPPLTDRSSTILTAVLLVLAPLVGLIAFRMLRQVPRAS